MTKPVYVEIGIRAPLESVWSHSQTPELHERWDLRFTDIEYLPRADEREPQRFRYATRIGFGLGIEGAGETVGERTSETERTSALRFWSNDRRSLIREGAGYWKYVRDGNAVRFLTQYDYQVRFGALGRFVDRICFRPLMGWATAWSFDRLRRWIEDRERPDASLRRFAAHALARCAVAFVWLWHGLVPKILANDPLEHRMVLDAGVAPHQAATFVNAAGIAETLLGLFVLVAWRSRVPLWLTLIAMVVATLCVVAASPAVVTAAFNPITLNLQLFVLAAVALLLGRDLPSAGACLRERPEGRTP